MEGRKSFRYAISMEKIEANIEVMQKLLKEWVHQHIVQEEDDSQREKKYMPSTSRQPPSQCPPPPPWSHDILDQIYQRNPETFKREVSPKIIVKS